MGRGKFIPALSIMAAFSITLATQAARAQEYSVSGQMPRSSDGDIIKEGELLNLDRCIEIGLARQPGILAARGTVRANQSLIGQAQSSYYPQVDLSAGYTRASPAPTSTSSTATAGQAFDFYSNSVTLKQNIYDFGKTSKQVKIHEINTDSALQDLENTVNQVAFNIKLAYYALLQSKRNLEVAQEVVKQFEVHLEEAKGFFEVGLKPKFDVTKAEADLSNSRVNLIKAQNALRLARVSLNSAMGVTNAPEYEVEDNLIYQKYEITMDEAMKKSFEERPDIKSAVSKRKSAEENINLSKKSYYPTLTGNAAYNWAGEKYPLEEGWNVGATINLPIFSGFLIKYQVRESMAAFDVASANEDALKQSVFFDVQQSYLNLKEAEERIPAAELFLKQATENLNISNGRYAAGVGNPIEVTDAEVLYINAQAAYIQALTDYRTAQASLEKAIGSR